MTHTKTTVADGEGIDLGVLPDARVTIDLKEVEGGEWIAYDPDDETSIVGRAESGPRAAEDYCTKLAELIEDGER